MFWNCAGHRDVFLIAEQSLHRTKAFSASQRPVSRLGVPKELEGTQLTQTDLRDIPDHGIPCSVWNNGRRKGGVWGDGVCVAVTRGGARLPSGG